ANPAIFDYPNYGDMRPRHTSTWDTLRDHYAHIEERALGMVKGKPDPRAEEAWLLDALLVERKFTDGHGSRWTWTRRRRSYASRPAVTRCRPGPSSSRKPT